MHIEHTLEVARRSICAMESSQAKFRHSWWRCGRATTTVQF